MFTFIFLLNMMLQNIRLLFPRYTRKQQYGGKKDVNSMKFLIDRNLTQSQSIRLGTELENVFRDYILRQTSMRGMNEKCITKQCDHLFRSGNTIYYAELKCNLNLDTEKSVSTYKKCQQIKNQLSCLYPHYDVRMFLVSLRFYKKELVPNTIRNKYKNIDENLCGINDYLIQLGLEGFVDESEYKKFVNEFVNVIF